MKKLFFLTLVLCCVVSLGLAQELTDKSPIQTSNFENAVPTVHRVLGDVLWSMDVEAITGDNRMLGCEFDGTDYWFTGAGYYDGTVADPVCYLYQVSAGGVLLNTYEQPDGNDGYWGWRDLAWDGTYLYAGDDTANATMITQIDPADGQPTGVYYGPTPINPCRALAYDAANDCFYTASWGSAIYKVERDNTVTVIAATTGYSTYGMAMADDMLWVWNQDGNGLQADEFNIGTGAYTGTQFAGDQSVGGGATIAGGAGCYDNGSAWEFIGQGQGEPDMMVAYEIPYYVYMPLEIAPEAILGMNGGYIHFGLKAGVENAGRMFGIFGTKSGTSPGTALPSGGLVLPINWDAVTDQLVMAAAGGNPQFPLFGNLNGSGDADLVMTLMRKVRYEDITLNFAYTLAGEPWDFVSNDVELFIQGEPIPLPEYKYDDGGTEDSLGLTSGGQICWLQWFDTLPGQDTLTHIKTAWGTPGGTPPPDGTAAFVYVWDDPNGDGDPTDGVLLASAATTVQNGGTDTFTQVDIPDTVVSGRFFIGASCDQVAGQYAAPLDQSQNPTGGQAWVVGDTTSNLDVNDLANNDVPPTNLQGIGFDAYLLTRAPYL